VYTLVISLIANAGDPLGVEDFNICGDVLERRQTHALNIDTGMLNPAEAKYANGALVELPYPTNDVRLMTKAATESVNRLFRPGFKYSKAEVLLMDLREPGEFMMTSSLIRSLSRQIE